jgi:hypothetical protein
MRALAKVTLNFKSNIASMNLSRWVICTLVHNVGVHHGGTYDMEYDLMQPFVIAPLWGIIIMKLILDINSMDVLLVMH